MKLTKVGFLEERLSPSTHSRFLLPNPTILYARDLSGKYLTAHVTAERYHDEIVSTSTSSRTGRASDVCKAQTATSSPTQASSSMSETMLRPRESPVGDDERNCDSRSSAEPARSAAERSQSPSLLDLPYDMIDAVIRRVDLRSLSALACVCHSLNELTVRGETVAFSAIFRTFLVSSALVFPKLF